LDDHARVFSHGRSLAAAFPARQSLNAPGPSNAAQPGCARSARGRAVRPAGESDGRRRREEAATRSVRLLAAPVLPIPTHLDLAEWHRFVEPVDVITALGLPNLLARELEAVVDAAAMGAIDGTHEMPFCD